MSKLDDILGTTEIAKRYPAEYGNKKIQFQKQLIKDLFDELIDESMPQGTYHVNTEVLRQKVKDL